MSSRKFHQGQGTMHTHTHTKMRNYMHKVATAIGMEISPRAWHPTQT